MIAYIMKKQSGAKRPELMWACLLIFERGLSKAGPRILLSLSRCYGVGPQVRGPVSPDLVLILTFTLAIK